MHQDFYYTGMTSPKCDLILGSMWNPLYQIKFRYVQMLFCTEAQGPYVPLGELCLCLLGPKIAG